MTESSCRISARELNDPDSVHWVTALLLTEQLDAELGDISRECYPKIVAEAFFRRWLFSNCGVDPKEETDGLGKKDSNIRKCVFGQAGEDEELSGFRDRFEAELLPLRNHEISSPCGSQLSENFNSAYLFVQEKIQQFIKCHGFIPIVPKLKKDALAIPFSIELLPEGSEPFVDQNEAIVGQWKRAYQELKLDFLETPFPVRVRLHCAFSNHWSSEEMTGPSFLIPLFFGMMRFLGRMELSPPLVLGGTGSMLHKSEHAGTIDEVVEVPCKVKLAGWMGLKHFVCPQSGSGSERMVDGVRIHRIPPNIRISHLEKDLPDWLEENNLAKRSPVSGHRKKFSKKYLQDKFVPPLKGSDRYEQLQNKLEAGKSVIVIEADPGHGKTSLMAYWSYGRQPWEHGDCISFFISDEDNVDLSEYHVFLDRELERIYPFLKGKDFNDLDDKLQFLNKLPLDIHTLFLLVDGLDESHSLDVLKRLLEGIKDYSWIRVILTSQPGQWEEAIPLQVEPEVFALPLLGSNEMRGIAEKMLRGIGLEVNSDEFLNCVLDLAEGAPLYLDLFFSDEQECQQRLDDFQKTGNLDAPRGWRRYLDHLVELILGEDESFAGRRDLLSLFAVISGELSIDAIREFFEWGTNGVPAQFSLEKESWKYVNSTSNPLQALRRVLRISEENHFIGFFRSQFKQHLRDSTQCKRDCAKWMKRLTYLFSEKIADLKNDPECFLFDYALRNAHHHLREAGDFERFSKLLDQLPDFLELQKACHGGGPELNRKYFRAAIHVCPPYEELKSEQRGEVTRFFIKLSKADEEVLEQEARCEKILSLIDKFLAAAEISLTDFINENFGRELGNRSLVLRFLWEMVQQRNSGRKGHHSDCRISEAYDLANLWSVGVIWPEHSASFCWAQQKLSFWEDSFVNAIEGKLKVREGTGRVDRNLRRRQFNEWFAKGEDNIVGDLPEKLEEFLKNGWFQDIIEFYDKFEEREVDENKTLVQRYLEEDRLYSLHYPLKILEFLTFAGDAIAAQENDGAGREAFFERAYNLWEKLRSEIARREIDRFDLLHMLGRIVPLLARLGKVEELLELVATHEDLLRIERKRWVLLKAWQTLCVNEHELASHVFETAHETGQTSGKHKLFYIQSLFSELLRLGFAQPAFQVRDMAKSMILDTRSTRKERYEALIELLKCHVNGGDLDGALDFLRNEPILTDFYIAPLDSIYLDLIKSFLGSQEYLQSGPRALKEAQKALEGMRSLDPELCSDHEYSCEQAMNCIKEFVAQEKTDFDSNLKSKDSSNIGHWLREARSGYILKTNELLDQIASDCLHFLRKGDHETFNAISSACGKDLWGDVILLPVDA